MGIRRQSEPYVHRFCAVDIFNNITRRQAISPVAKFNHMLGRGFMIQRVILYSYLMFEKSIDQTLFLFSHYIMQFANECLPKIV